MLFYLIPIAFVIPMLAKYFFKKEITTIEWILHTIVSVIIAVIIPYALVHIAGYDTQVLSGYVTDKKRVYNPKDESYDCNPHTVKDSKGNSSTAYDTCHRTIPEWDYVVYSTVDDVKIDRVDAHGRQEPLRFTNVVIGEPFATEKSYLNYLKLSESTLYKDLVNKDNKYTTIVPEYPEVFDYYRYNRIIINGNVSMDYSKLNDILNNDMKIWGAKYQINPIIILLDENVTMDYFYALKAKWIGGKKNDVVVLIQMDKDKNVGWSRVMSRADSEVFNKSVEMDLQNIKDISADKIMTVLSSNIQERYKRMDFDKEYSILENDFDPSWMQIFLCVCSLLLGSALVMCVYKYGEARYASRYGY